MRFLVISGIGFVVIGVVFGIMNHYLWVDREVSRSFADRALLEFCRLRGLIFTADHRGVVAGMCNCYSWWVEVALLVPQDRVVEAESFGRMVLRRHLPLKKSVLFDFIRDSEDALVLTGFREEIR